MATGRAAHGRAVRLTRLMRALLALAALLPLAGAPAASALPQETPPNVPALVILRAACAARDPSAFAPERVFARVSAPHSLRVLGYNGEIRGRRLNYTDCEFIGRNRGDAFHLWQRLAATSGGRR